VLLLARKGNSNKLLRRLISILDELEGHVKDQIVLEILNLHRRYFKLQQQYSQERSKTIELNKKIERLKGLEQDLDKSNTRIQESLKPVP
jgi:predicted RNase H-like nuclease (RuvC/YqgF family)